MRELSPLFGMGTLELGTHYHCTPTSDTRDTVRRVDPFITIPPSRTDVLPDRAAILDFAKGAFFEVNRVKNHTLYLYLPELLICVKGMTEVVFYFVFSFTVKEGSKKERRPIANRQLLYQSSLKPHFLPHGATVTSSLNWLLRSPNIFYEIRVRRKNWLFHYGWKAITDIRNGYICGMSAWIVLLKI